MPRIHKIAASGVILTGMVAFFALGAVASAASAPTFSGYSWPMHQHWQYQTDLTNAVSAQLLVPNQDLSRSTTGSGMTQVTVKETEHWMPELTIRTGGIQAGGMFVELTLAKAPLLLSVAAPQMGADQGQSLAMPALTVEGRLTRDGQWTIIKPLTAEGALPSGVSAKALVPMATTNSNFVPPVPALGWLSGQSFTHDVSLDPTTLLASLLSGDSATVVKGGDWTVASQVTPTLNSKGNWSVVSQANTPSPLTASFRTTVANEGLVKMKVAMTVDGSSQIILSGALGGLFRHQVSDETVTVKVQGSVYSAKTKTASPVNESLTERLAWTVSPLYATD